MTLQEMQQTVDEASATIRKADSMIPHMIRLCRGRLRNVSQDYSDRRVLADLKKELRDFNITTLQWKEGK